MVPPGPGTIIWGSGGPWDYYLGIWGPKIILNFVSFYRVKGPWQGARGNDRHVVALKLLDAQWNGGSNDMD